MKLYDGGRAPNPRRVRIFLAEKGIDIETIAVDMQNMGHKSAEITAKNPLQKLPILELDDGTIITESVAICRYIEELHPSPNLMGQGALEVAVIEMWQRQIEFYLFLPIANVFRHSHAAMKEWEVPQIREFAEANIPKVKKFLAFLEKELENKTFIAGEKFTIADITMLVAVDFMKPAKLTLSPELKNLHRWYNQINQRESVKQNV